jgi:hypothetical protein
MERYAEILADTLVAGLRNAASAQSHEPSSSKPPRERAEP